MIRAGIRDVKAHLSRYIRTVRNGTLVMITDRNNDVALLTPVETSSRLQKDLRKAIAAGVITGEGQKPRGPTMSIRLPKNRSLSAAILEQRE